MMIWVYILLSYISLFVLGFSDNIRGPVFPMVLEKFSLSDGEGSWAFALASMLGFFGSLVGGRALLLFRKIKVLSFSLLLMAGAMAGMAFAPSFMWFLIASAVFGFALGLMGVSQNTMVTIGTPPERRSQILSGLHAMYGLASLTAPLIVAFWLKQGWPWQYVFLVATFFSLLVFINTLIWKGPPFEGVSEDRRRGVSERGQVLAAVILGAYVVAEIMVSTRLTLFMTRFGGQSVEQASLMVTYFFILLLAGRMLMAFVKIPLKLSMQLKASLIGSVVLVLLGLNGWPWGFVLSGFTMAPFYPLAISYISLSFPDSLESAIAKTMAAQSLLVVVMHFAVGYFSDMYGLISALYVGPFFLLVSFLSLMWFEKKVLKKCI
ncbi:MAG: MFS transporter [Bdellovibrionia bacterium]